MKHLILISLFSAILTNCKSRSTQSASEEKAIFNETASGAEIISDMSECVAKMGVPDFSKVYDDATALVKEEIGNKIKKNESLKNRALSSVELVRANIDLKGVTDQAVKYVNDRKPEIYSLLGYKLATAVPTGMTLMFYHPVLKEIDLSTWTKKVLPSADIKLLPYIGIVVVPTCVTSIDAATNKTTNSWRIRMGASMIGIWRMQPKSGQAAEGGVGTVSDAHVGWHVMGGFVWGALYEPNQLRGPMFGFNGAFANRKSKASNVNLPNEAVEQASPSSGKSLSVVLRPMVMWGYKNPDDAKGFKLKTVLDSLIGNALNTETGLSAPTHLTMMFDVTNEPTTKSYVHPYLGFQITSSEVIEEFLQRPIIVRRSASGASTEVSAVEQ